MAIKLLMLWLFTPAVVVVVIMGRESLTVQRPRCPLIPPREMGEPFSV